MSLTFEAIRVANTTRCGQSFHPINSWSPTDWGCAMAGEVGEACNFLKKLRRLDDNKQLANIPTNRDEIIADIAKELADVVLYADLLAARLNIDLGKSVADKFNEVSDRVKSDVKIMTNGVVITARQTSAGKKTVLKSKIGKIIAEQG